MSLFNRNRNSEEETLENAPMDSEEESSSREFQAGLSNPSEGGGFKTRRSGKQMVLVFGLGSVLIIALLTYAYFQVFGFPEAIKKTATASISETEYLQRLEEIKELERRLQIADDDRIKMLREMDARISERLAEIKTGTDPEVVKQMEAMAQNQAALNAVIEDLRKRLEARPPEEIAPPEPKIGSQAPSLIFTRVEQIRAKQEAIEEEARKKAAIPPLFDARPGLQLGTIVPAVLKTTLVSSAMNERFIAIAETMEPFEFTPGFVLPKGVLFLGKVTPDFDSRRMFVDVERMQYSNVDIAIEGVMLDQRSNPGMVTKYVDPLTQSTGIILLSNMIAATASALQETSTYINNQTGEREEYTKKTPKNAMYEGLASTLQTQSQILMEAQARKKPVILVKEGIPVKIQITSKMPLDVLVESGVVGSAPKNK